VLAERQRRSGDAPPAASAPREDGAVRRRRQWSELSPAARTAIVVAGAAEVVLTAVCLRDLARRPARDVRGPKPLWVASFAVQPFGPLLYLAAGRRAAPTSGSR
jgi:hypothetical protein